MITLEQAKAMFSKMIAESEKSYTIDTVYEICFDEPIYAMIVLDEDGNQLFPGEVFPSIRKADGAIINYIDPCPA